MTTTASSTDIGAEKAKLRMAALARRAAMGAATRAAASRGAADRAMRAVEAACSATEPASLSGRAVALFASFRDEIDTAPLARALRARGAALVLPVVVGRASPLSFRLWNADDPLAPQGAFAIPTPRADAPEMTPQIVLVPLAAFDRRGYRIGYGVGFYDRTLARLRAHQPVAAIGYGFACQEVEKVPAEPHDVPVDLMVTEAEVIPCRPCRAR